MLRILFSTVLVVSALAKHCKQNPDYSCSSSQTCCLLPDDEGVGCCPFKKGVCCEDKIHCCPNGMTCDVKNDRCLGDGVNMLLQSIVPGSTNIAGNKKSRPQSRAKPRHPLAMSYSFNESVFQIRKNCPDADFSCDTNQTCCQLTKGWGCCPLGPHSVCCSDKQHCCPRGYVCNNKNGDCIKA